MNRIDEPRCAAPPTGLLLVNLGTPRAPTTGAVRRYLREFLGDPRVIDLPGPLRWLLVNAIIAPFRAPKSAALYRNIWSTDGSPLLVHGVALRDALRERLGGDWRVELGMRYGEPSLGDAFAALVAHGCARIVVLPLYPQYASSTTGSTLERVFAIAGAQGNVPAIETIGAFYDDPGFIEAQAALARPRLASFRPDHVLLSYHGLPERHVRRADPSDRHCLVKDGCCDAIGPANRDCYRAHCFATSRALARVLGLEPQRWSTSFQSRLGRTPWIRPYTDEIVADLARRGVKRLAVLCPSFVADCLETLEEIGLRLRERWQELGGEAFELVPCVNASPPWIDAVVALVAKGPRAAAAAK
jgi:ferrochelatase